MPPKNITHGIKIKFLSITHIWQEWNSSALVAINMHRSNCGWEKESLECPFLLTHLPPTTFIFHRNKKLFMQVIVTMPAFIWNHDWNNNNMISFCDILNLNFYMHHCNRSENFRVILWAIFSNFNFSWNFSVCLMYIN